MAELASRFGRRLTLGTIGLGNSRGDFEVLRKMAEAAAECACVATFKMPSLTSIPPASVNYNYILILILL